MTHTTTFGYDSRGALTSITDPLTHQLTIGPDAAGRPASLTDFAGTIQVGYAAGDLVSVTNGLGHTTQRFLDAGGRETARTNALGHTAQAEYDPFNQALRLTDALGADTALTYDGNGNVRSVTDARQGRTEYTYDAMDRLETRTDPLLREERYAYDLNGNLRQVTDRKGQITIHVYDALNRLKLTTWSDGSTTQYTYDAGNRLRQVVDSVSGTTTLDYDDLDRLTLESTVRGTVTYTYDAADRRRTMTVAGQPTVTYDYDDANRLTTITQGSSIVTFEYDAADRRTALELPNGVRVEYAYNAASQLTGLTYKLGMTVLGTLTYAYDSAGRRTETAGTWARTALPAPLTSATYDPANRLTQWASMTLTYDENGNLLTEGARSYGWDARNQLAAIGGGLAGSFQYDAFGRRMSKTVGGATTEYVYDGVDVAQELAGATPTAHVLHGPGTDEPLVRTDAAGTRMIVADGLGSAVALLDGAGVLQTQYTYAPFGSSSGSGTWSGNASQFTARENDGTGLYYYRARYYSPELQRFVGEDPLDFGGGDPNLYAYAGNAPTLWTDPFGLSRLDQMLDWLQTALDLGGLVPGFGEPLDLLNAGVSATRGDTVGAGMSIASMMPIGGQAATAAKIARRFNKDQQALVDLAKACKRRGVTPEEAEILKDWARETGVRPARGPEVDPNRNYNVPHIRIGPVNHIPVR